MRRVQLKSKNQAGRMGIVLGALTLAAVVVVPWGYATRQGWGAISAAVAWATCVVAGLVAQGVVGARGEAGGGMRLIAGMAARMGIPLAACLIVCLQRGPLAQAGFVYYLLAYYFVMLIVQTVVLLGSVPPQATGKPMV